MEHMSMSWHNAKDIIKDLYLIQDLTLDGDNGVMANMARAYDFHAS